MKNVEDIYPLSPMQEMMLLRALSGGGSGLFTQLVYDVKGETDPDAFRTAWETMTARHAALRTAFAWQGLKRPMQIVRREVELPFACHDWRDLGAAAQAARFDALLQSDRDAGFDLSRAPLHRVTLVLTGPRQACWVWSSHHLIVDRWCMGALLRELAETCTDIAAGRPLGCTPAPPFKRYVAWVEAQARGAAAAFWHDALGTLGAPSPMTARRADAPGEHAALDVSAETAGALRNLARTSGATVGTALQLAWALVVNRHTGSTDVVHGLTVAGRPPALDDVESIIGTFVNNVPVRWRLSAEASAPATLREGQAVQHRRLPHEHVSHAAMRACSGIAEHEDLYDTLIVWLAAVDAPSAGARGITQRESTLETAYPVTLSIHETGECYALALRVRPGFATAAPASRLLADLDEALAYLVRAGPDTCFGSWPGFVAPSAGPRADTAPPGAWTPPPEASGDAGVTAGRERLDRDITLDMLRTEWRSVLGCEDVALADDFFALGGDSVRAAQLHARVATATRTRIPLLPLFADSTLAGMTRAICEGDWPMHDAVCTPLAMRGSEAPLFLIASPEVNTVGYALLVRHLAAARPVYLLQTPPDGDDVRRLSPHELPELARTYVEAMREVQSSGPYRLLAMCVGAQIGVEMARHLEADGDRACFLGIINTYAYYTISRLIVVHRVLKRLQWYRRRLGELASLDPAGRTAMLRTIMHRKLAAAVNPPPAAARNAWVHEVGRVRRDAPDAPIASPITVFRIARQAFWRVPDRALGWGRHASEVSVVDLYAPRHLEILREPRVREVAAHVDARLAAPGGA